MAMLLPYEFSPFVLVVIAGAAWLYLRGRTVAGSGSRGSAVLFWLGLALLYAMLQTRFDYYAQHMFFMHRLQHLVLHHLAPFLLVAAAPGRRLYAGLPAAVRPLLAPLRSNRLLSAFYLRLQQPVVAALLFVGLIGLWLLPEVHFFAMLNLTLYDTMNWGMAVDGLLFWQMVLHMRARGVSDARHYGGRLLLLFLIMLPQIVIGSYIALCGRDLYAVYAVCGRVWPLSAQLDQQIGGLVTWIPAAMMSIAGALLLLRQWLGSGERTHTEDEACCGFS